MLGFNFAKWSVEFCLEAEQMVMRRLLEFSSCWEKWPCQGCVKWGLPTCRVHCNANRASSASWRAIISD